MWILQPGDNEHYVPYTMPDIWNYEPQSWVTAETDDYAQISDDFWVQHIPASTLNNEELGLAILTVELPQ